jgi:hypothetical protein
MLWIVTPGIVAVSRPSREGHKVGQEIAGALVIEIVAKGSPIA